MRNSLLKAGLLTLLLFFVAADRGMALNSYTRLPIFRSELKTLSDKAVLLAADRLADNPKDETGLMLLRLAEHFTPERREVLLLRGKLYYKVKIKKPKNPPSPQEFVRLLQRSLDRVQNKNSVMGRHLTALFCAMIRLFKPDDERAIIILTKFRDAGFATELKELFARNFQQTNDIKYDEKDPRYVVSNIKKSILVPANQPWTDTFVKVKAGKFVRVKAFRTWDMGDVGRNISACDADGYPDFNPLDSNSKKREKKKKGKAKKSTDKLFYKGELKARPGSLLAKIGKKRYPVVVKRSFASRRGNSLFWPLRVG